MQSVREDSGRRESQHGGSTCRAPEVVAAALGVAAALSGCLALVWNDAFVSSAFKAGVPLSPDAYPLMRATRVVLFGLSLAFLLGGFLALARRGVVEGFRARHRKRIDDLLTALVTIVLLLVLLEVAARVVTGRQTSELGGAAYRAQLARIPLNSFGLRDREFPVDKPPGIVRILVLGDSFTFGHGIENESAPWPRVLETILNRDAPADTVYQVINTAHNGFGTAEELTALRASLVFHPDLVILGYFFNDAETDEMILHPPSLTTVQRLLYGVHFALFSHSYLYGLAVVRWDILKIALGLEKSAPQEWEEIYMHPEHLTLHKQQLLQIHSVAASVEAPLLIVTIPGNYDFAHYPLAAGHAFMRRFCQEQRLSCIDPLPAFVNEDYRRTRLNPHDAHPSEYGHRLIAQTIYDSPVFREALRHGPR